MNTEMHITAHALSINNKTVLLKSDQCGCFYCAKIFLPLEIKEWFQDKIEETGVCPYCGIDAVIPKTEEVALSMDLLQAMREHWFYPK